MLELKKTRESDVILRFPPLPRPCDCGTCFGGFDHFQVDVSFSGGGFRPDPASDISLD